MYILKPMADLEFRRFTFYAKMSHEKVPVQ